MEWSSLKKSQEAMNIYEWDDWCFGYGAGVFDYCGVARGFWPIVQFVLWLNEVS